MRKCLFVLVILCLQLAFGQVRANAQSDEVHDFIIPKNAEWSYAKGVIQPPAKWKDLGFDDSRWRTGHAGFGYGDGDDVTVLSDMRHRYDKLYIRRDFTLEDIPETLYLYIDYDDAFIAYVNGKAVARRHISASGEVDSHEAGETYVIELGTQHLKAGENVLAIAGYNSSKGSSDFSLSPALAASPDLLNLLSKTRAQKDISVLRERVLAQSSYYNIFPERDVLGALDRVEQQLPDMIERVELYKHLVKVIALTSDGHSSVRASDLFPDGKHRLPLSFVEVEGGVIGVNQRENKFPVPGFPYVTAIDGIDIERWIDAASEYRAKASPQVRRSRGVRALGYRPLLCVDMAVSCQKDPVLTFANADGATKTKTMKLQERRHGRARISKGDSRILDQNIGYLVIPAMDNDLIPDVVDFMKKAKDTDALIIDVRDNGGGRYGILQALAGFLLPEDHGPLVNNIAAFRLAPYFDADHIEYRPTFRADHEGWTEGERSVINAAFAAFEPEWTPPQEDFSEWHFMLLNRDQDRKAHHYYYDKPVIVLANVGSFSATDGFVSSVHKFPNVTVIGKPTGGGSGATRRFVLPESGMRVALSSMASFRPNGKLYDGNGVEVDIEIDAKPEDYIEKGDFVLERAIGLLQEQR